MEAQPSMMVFSQESSSKTLSSFTAMWNRKAAYIKSSVSTVTKLRSLPG